jgi:hypothetical protein
VRMVPPKLTVTKSPFPKVTPRRVVSDLLEVLEVHVVPSDEVYLSLLPTVTKVPFP